MLKHLRMLAKSRGYRTIGLAPSASAAKTLASGSCIDSETLQRFLALHDGIAYGRGTAEGLRKLRAAHAKTILVVDESSLRVKRANEEPPADRDDAQASPRGVGRRREAARRGRGGQASPAT